MKRIIFLTLLFFCHFIAAQITISAKAHLLFPTSSASWKNLTTTLSNAYEKKGQNKIGYNVGVSIKGKLGILAVMPELYYTHFKNEFTEPITNMTLSVDHSRVDLPILIGSSIFGDAVTAFVGPVASYNLSTDNTFGDFQENASKKFTLGYQMGTQLQIKKIILSVRYESAFSNEQRDYINTKIGNSQVVRYDNRPTLLLIGAGLRF